MNKKEKKTKNKNKKKQKKTTTTKKKKTTKKKQNKKKNKKKTTTTTTKKQQLYIRDKLPINDKKKRKNVVSTSSMLWHMRPNFYPSVRQQIISTFHVKPLDHINNTRYNNQTLHNDSPENADSACTLTRWPFTLQWFCQILRRPSHAYQL